MGNYFLMSFRFNKQKYADFGLVQTNKPEIFKRDSDCSLWKFRPLYNFGWGKENGYCKIPIPGFNKLVDIILYSKNKDDKYGAAAVILDDFSDVLLDKCFEILNNEKNLKKYSNFFEILQLQDSLNRSSIIGKSYSRIADDFNRWEIVAKKVSKLLKSK